MRSFWIDFFLTGPENGCIQNGCLNRQDHVGRFCLFPRPDVMKANKSCAVLAAWRQVTWRPLPAFFFSALQCTDNQYCSWELKGTAEFESTLWIIKVRLLLFIRDLILQISVSFWSFGNWALQNAVEWVSSLLTAYPSLSLTFLANPSPSFLFLLGSMRKHGLWSQKTLHFLLFSDFSHVLVVWTWPSDNHSESQYLHL